MNRIRKYLSLVLLLGVLAGCGQKPIGQREESQEAKQLLQGMWSDAETETLVFKMEGDSVYYPDSTSMTAYFKVIEDTLYIGSTARYGIVKHTEHVLWFSGADGELVKLVKNSNEAVDSVFIQNPPQIQTLTEVLKRDTVITHQGNRYHLYVAINPTRYKVIRHTLNEEGLDVENVYYDNIIHLSIFQGNTKLFSRDFRKAQYQKRIPDPVLEQAVLNDMQYVSTDSQGFHFNVSLCVPGDASCYLIEHVVTVDGQLSTQLLEY